MERRVKTSGENQEEATTGDTSEEEERFDSKIEVGNKLAGGSAESGGPKPTALMTYQCPWISPELALPSPPVIHSGDDSGAE